MAMIYDISALAQNKLSKDVSEIKPLKKRNDGLKEMCDDEWNCFYTRSWSIVNSLQQGNINNLITDRRWNDLPTYITTHVDTRDSILDYQLAATLSYADNLTIPFSVQVEKEAHVFVCDGDVVPESKCYWYLLQAWSGKKSGFRMCEAYDIQSRYNGKSPGEFCRDSTKKKDHNRKFPEFLSKYHWSHFKIVKTGDEYRLEHQNGSNIFSINTARFRINPKHLFFHTKAGTGLWRVHDFKYFYSVTADDYVQSKRLFPISAGENCLAMFVVMCEFCSMNIKLLTSYDQTILEIIVDTQDQQWKEIKHVFHVTEHQEAAYLRIFSRSSKKENNFWAFNSLRACAAEEITVLKTLNPSAWTKRCQLIENGMEVDKNSKKMSALENWEKCNETQFGEDCLPCELIFNDNYCPSTSKYCQLISGKSGIEQKCYCSIGSGGEDCKERCNSSYQYGQGCQRSCENCQETCHRDPIFGKCDSEQCSNNFAGEKCDRQTGIYFFDDLPEIEIGSTSCTLKVKSFRGKGDSSKRPPFYKFQYKQVNEAIWKDVTKEPLTFNSADKVTLGNLKTETTYSVRVFGFEPVKDLIKIIDLVSKSILIQNITTTCKDINENQIEIEPDAFSAQILFYIDEEKSKETCDISKYTILYNNNIIEQSNNEYEYLINNLEPYTEYNISVRKNDDPFCVKTFRTKESVPERVEKFSYDKTTNPSTLWLKWSRPIKANGELLFYHISFKLVKYEACKNYIISRKIEEFTKVFPVNTEEWLEETLKPYAKYRIEIKANTSAGFGPPVSRTVTTDPLESIKEDEIPPFQEAVPETDMVRFKFLEVPCEKRTGPIHIDTTLTGTQFWCNSTKTSYSQELDNGDLVIRDLVPFCKYHANLKFYRRNEKIDKEKPISFETLESAPKKIRKLEVTSKGSNHISLRWLPPYPPTGHLEKYKIVHCTNGYRSRCDEKWISFDRTTPCKLWPDFHCTTINVETNIYTVKVQSKNKGRDKYSDSVEQAHIWADDKKKSKPPYDLSMKWTEENYLHISWYHPNETNGVLSGFKIYVNEANHRYEINSENDYYLIYNKTIKSGLTFPDHYNVKITARNLAGESDEGGSITGGSPPPIPEASVEHVDAKEKNIKVTFRVIKQYKKSLQQCLYLLITECSVCQEQLNSYKKDLLKHHRIYYTVMPIESIQVPQWKAIVVYDDMEENKFPRILEIGENSTNKVLYAIKPNTNYSLGFIWINQLEGYVRINSTIISIGTPLPTIQGSSLTGTIIILTVLIVAALILTVAYIRMKKEIHELLGCTKGSGPIESLYENHQILDVKPAIPYKSNRNSVIMRQMPDIICPGNPLFKTKNSRRIKLETFRQYVQNAHESSELSRQHKLFPQGSTKAWTYGALPQNKGKNRYKNLIAYNHSRVVLNKIDGDEHSDYINASYIDGYQCPRAYIATQGPKRNTVQDFWRMIWQEKVTYIVMMANVYEGGKKKTEQYWPDNGEHLEDGDFKITFIRSDVYASYEYRQFQLHYQHSKPRQVNQLHFKAWPDHGVPLYPQSLVPILERMLTFRSRDFPIVVHCSAGVGRTGTVILCDICLRMAAAEGFVDVLAMLEHLRNQRANMVDNIEQYKLAHLVILNCFMGLRTSISINQEFEKAVEKLLQNNNAIESQLQYIRDCEWEDDAMKTVFFMDDEEMPIVAEKNRSPDIIPDSTARVFLKPYPVTDPTPISTYINAVRTDAFCEPGRFIVTQYPLPNTAGDFWRLVADKEISVIICLNDIPVKDELCRLFFPISLETLNPEDTITVKHVKNKSFQAYTILTFEMTVTHPYQDSTITTVKIVKFRGWKTSQQIPDDYMDFLTFVEDATNIARTSSPALITCYDGATASGLFIAMSFLMEQIKLEQSCDVCQAVRSIRTSRKQFTNTEEQLKFLYKASLLYVEEKFSQYSNVNLL